MAAVHQWRCPLAPVRVAPMFAVFVRDLLAWYRTSTVYVRIHPLDFFSSRDPRCTSFSPSCSHLSGGLASTLHRIGFADRAALDVEDV
eukprot:scaffold281_cov318-Pavlova_lutheri.AAC.4